MQLKAVFFLFVLLFSLASSWSIQGNNGIKEDCCAKITSDKKCSKPLSHDKRECNTDYCNPFLTCSTTPIVLVIDLKISIPVQVLKNDYFLSNVGMSSDFSSKHWQPPQA
jgi:hypothetical protein